MKIKQGMKRKLALLLSGVLLAQTVFTGVTGGAQNSEEREGTSIAGDPISIKGTPNAAFKSLTMLIGNKVGDDNALFLSLNGTFKDSYLQNTLEPLIDDGKVLDEASWEGDNQGFGSYYSYLNAQTDLPEIHFSVALNFEKDSDAALDIGKKMTGDIITNSKDGDLVNQVIGRYELTTSSEGTSSRLVVTFDKMLYACYNIGFNKSIFASFTGSSDADSEVTVRPGGGSNDFWIDIPDYKDDFVNESNFEITKNDNAHKDDDPNLTYTVSAKVKNTTTLKASRGEADASKSEISKNSKSKEKKAASDSEPEEDRTLDPENDEDWEIEEEGTSKGPGLTGLIDLLVPKQNNANDISTYSELPEDSLSGYTIYDILPEGLTITKVESRINSRDDNAYVEIVQDADDNGYSFDENRVFTYIIPEALEGAKVTAVDLRITTRLSDAEYNKYMISNPQGGMTWNFTNRALLKTAPNGDTLTKTENVKSVIKLGAPFAKEEIPIDHSAGEFQWRLKVNSYFSSSSVTLYAVDHIKDVKKTHDYIPGSKIIIQTAGGVSERETAISLGALSADYSFDKITSIGVINTLLKEKASAIGENTTSPLVYTYDVAAEGTSPARTDAIMLVPLSAHTNQPVTITYHTKVAEREDLFGSGPLKLQNFAKILWKWEGGDGPGPGEEFGGATIDKDAEYKCSLVAKSVGAGYNETDNTIDWKFEVNQIGVSAEEITITDTLENDKQIFWSPKKAEKSPIVLTAYSGSTATRTEIPHRANALVNGDYYEITDNSADPTKTDLIVRLKNVDAKEHYSFNIKTFIVNPGLESSEADAKVHNSASVVVTRAGQQGTPFETEAETTVKNTLIRKESIQYENGSWYNYEDNTVKWRVKINPRRWTIVQPKITDILPAGTEFAVLTSAVRKGADGLESPLPITAGTQDSNLVSLPYEVNNGDQGSIKVSQSLNSGDLCFEFLNVNGQGATAKISEEYIFEFTTLVTDTWRKANLQSGKNKKPELINKATLTGYWEYENGGVTEKIEVKANDTATNKLLPVPMVKNGQYITPTTPPEFGTLPIEGETKASGVKWTLYVNRTKADFKGAAITDIIEDCMELLTDSMKVSIVHLDAAGNERSDIPSELIYSKADKINIHSFETLDYNKFEYKIPESCSAHSGNSCANSTLKFEFFTVMVDDAYKSDIKNAISIKGTGLEDSTADENVKDAADFYLDDYAYASTLGLIKLYKTSENQVDDYPLKGASFKIGEMIEPGAGLDRTVLGNWREPENFKTRVSNSKGSLSFMFLKPDMMYKITEETAPDGYDKVDKTWYVIPKLVKNLEYPASDSALPPAYEVVKKTGTKNYHIMTVENAPKKAAEGEGVFSFTKQGQNGQLLPGATFTAFNSKLKERTATSDITGIVTFKELEPGEKYTIRETTANGYLAGKPFYLQTSWDPVKEVVTAKVVGTPPEGFEGTAKIYRNTEIKRTGMFTKTNQNGDALTNKPVTFDVLRRGDGGNLLGSSDGGLTVCLDVDNDERMDVSKGNTTSQTAAGYYSYSKIPTRTTETDGSVKLEELLYGDYRLEEAGLPDGAVSGSDKAIVYIRVNETGMYASKNEFYNADRNRNGKTELSFTTDKTGKEGTKLQETASSFNVPNEMQYGIVQINKALGEKNSAGTTLEEVTGAAKLAGITFKIYKKLAGDNKELFLTLKTNDSGQFTVNGDGSYTDAEDGTKNRWLVTGDYILEEQAQTGNKIGDKYKLPPAYSFTIDAWESERTAPLTTYIAWDGTDYTTRTTDADGAVTRFLNEPERSTVTLKKIDAEDTSGSPSLLSGAKFKVWTSKTSTKADEDYVADLKEAAGNSGIYTLHRPAGQAGTDWAEKIGDKKYLSLSDPSNPNSALTILCGDYYLEEITAPVNYEKPKDRILVKVGEEPVTALPNGKNITNTVLKANIEFEKKVEVRKQLSANSFTTAFDSYKGEAGFGFTLTPDPLAGGKFDEVEKFTDSSGKVKFENVPIGTYILTETTIPERYGKMEAPYVDLMKQITVTVEEKVADDGTKTSEVTFKNAEGNLFPNPPAKEDGSSDNLITVSDSGSLVVRNNYKYGTAKGEKVGIYPASTDSIPLSGIKFTLTNTAKLSMEVESDTNGELDFTGLPYGAYTLTETAPAGYMGVIIPFVINNKNQNYTIKNNDTTSKIENQLILKAVKFLKVDQNGDPLGNSRADIKFTIKRDSGSEPQLLPGGVDWTAGKTESADAAGIVTFTDLPYGTYTVTENISSASGVIKQAAAPFKITIGRDPSDAARTKVTMKTDAPGSMEKSISQTDAADGSGTYDFSIGANAFKLKNTVKSGDIRISKQLGELQGDSTVTDGNKKLAGIAFNIYKDSSTPGTPAANVFAVLTTDNQGNFVKDDNGKYGGKELLVDSTYYLKEVFPENSFFFPLPDSDYIPFTVTDKEAASKQVTEFAYDGTSVTSSPVGESAAPAKFYNIPKRGTVTVEKQDVNDSSALLSGAEFGIYAESACTNQVASLKEAAGVPGIYKLDGTGFTKEKSNVPYLSNATGAWKLLAGDYWIKELKAPEGYKLSEAVEKVAVYDDSDPDNVNETVIITNTLSQVDIKFLKVDQNKDLIKAKTDGKRKLTFTLSRVPSGADGITETALDIRAKEIIEASGYPEITNDASGMVSVTGLIAGNYKLTEASSTWVSSPAAVYIIVSQNSNATLTVTLGSTTPAGSAADKKVKTVTPPATGNAVCDFSTGDAAFKLENQLTYGLVDILKVAAEINENNKLTPLSTPIPGVVFKVYEDVNADEKYQSTDLEKLTMVTGADGKFVRDSSDQYKDERGTSQSYRLVYGKSYLLKEVKLPSENDLDQKYQIDDHYYAFTVGASKYYYIGTDKADNVVSGDIQNIKESDTAPAVLPRFPNAPMRRGDVVLQKTDADETLSSQPVKGAEFAVYTNSGEKLKVARLLDKQNGTYELQPLDASQPEKPENSSGQAYLKKMADGRYYLLGGKYYIKETKAPAGYMTPEDKAENYWYFTITGEGETIGNANLSASDGQAKAFTNSLWSRTITVQKLVENLQKGKFHAAGTQAIDDNFTFELKAKNGVAANGKPFTPVTKAVEITGANQGKAVFADIPAGEYTLTEIMNGPAKQGGILSDIYAAPVTVSVLVNEKGVFYNGSTASATQFTVQNLLKRGSVTGKKITVDANDNPVNLANAEFTLTPVAPARAGTLTAVSNSKGEFVFQNIPLGEYELRETKTPDSSYEISGKTYRVKVTAENQNITSDTSSAPIEFVNHASGSFTIEKREQVVRSNDINGIMVPGQGFTFRITGMSPVAGQLQDFFDTANVEGAASAEKKADGIYVTTGVTGKITFHNLPVGDYTVREQISDKTNATGAYLPDEKEKTINITIDHATGKVVITPEAAVKVDNFLKRGQIEGLKTTADKTTPLAGAVIGLFPSGTTAYTEENLWCGQKITTGADGKFLFQKVPYGTYLIAELAAPNGYNLNTTTRYEVTVSDDKTVKTTGFLIEGTEPKAAAESPILIANTKKSSGGGGGGGGGDTKPPTTTGPGPGTPTTSPNETSPVNPGETIPNNPLPTIPVETNPGGGNEIIIPPETPPGSDLEIKNPNGDTVYTGKVDENGRVHVDLPPGTYTLVTFDENQVPLGSMTFTIEDPFTPLGALAAPNAGDNSVSIVVLAVLMMISLAGMVLVVRKKKEEKQNPEGKE